MRNAPVVFLWSHAQKHLAWNLVPLKCSDETFKFAAFSPHSNWHYEDMVKYPSLEEAIAHGRQFVEQQDATNPNKPKVQQF